MQNKILHQCTKSGFPGKNPDFSGKIRISSALSFLTFPFLVNSNLTLMNIKIEDGQWMREREEDIFKEWVANVRAHTCDVVRVRAVRKLGVRFACMRPENGSQLTFGDFYDGLCRKEFIDFGFGCGLYFKKECIFSKINEIRTICDIFDCELLL